MHAAGRASTKLFSKIKNYSIRLYEHFIFKKQLMKMEQFHNNIPHRISILQQCTLRFSYYLYIEYKESIQSNWSSLLVLSYELRVYIVSTFTFKVKTSQQQKAKFNVIRR